MIISIDLGNNNIKTENFVFPTAISSSEEPMLFNEEVLEYNGKYYSNSGKRIPYYNDKTQDERFFTLTLFGIAKELDLKMQKSIEAGKTKKEGRKNFQITLLGGFPLKHMRLKDKYEKHFKHEEPIDFTFNGINYRIRITETKMYPQALSAAYTVRKEVFKEDAIVVVDIGGYTVDYVVFENGRTNPDDSKTLENGVNIMYSAINEYCTTQYNLGYREFQIDKMIKTRKTKTKGEDGEAALKYVLEHSEQFANDIIAKIRELGIDYRTTPLLFVGGGSTLLGKYFEKNDNLDASYVDDICANAKGYKILYKLEKMATSK